MTLNKPKRKRKRGGRVRGQEKRFVVQEHRAQSRHWDLRLQVDGEMWSWAIPKGPSLDPKDRRLAVETSPHSLPYSEFEGIIAEGLYGAGKVIQWDVGTFVPEDDIKKSIKDGIVRFELKGKKLRGRWALVKTGARWLLIKENDKYAKKDYDIVARRTKSVKSGKEVDEITEKDGHIIEETDLGFDLDRG